MYEREILVVDKLDVQEKKSKKEQLCENWFGNDVIYSFAVS